MGARDRALIAFLVASAGVDVTGFKPVNRNIVLVVRTHVEAEMFSVTCQDAEGAVVRRAAAGERGHLGKQKQSRRCATPQVHRETACCVENWVLGAGRSVATSWCSARRNWRSLGASTVGRKQATPGQQLVQRKRFRRQRRPGLP